MQELRLRASFFLLDYEKLNIYFFSPICLLHFFFSNHLSDILLSTKLTKKRITWLKLHSLS